MYYDFVLPDNIQLECCHK